MEPQKSSKTADTIFKVLATVGFLVILLAIVWGAILVARKAPPAFSSLSSAVVTFLSFGGDSDTDGTPSGTDTPTTTPTSGTPTGGTPTTPSTPSTPTKPTVSTPGTKTETSYTFGGTGSGTVINPKGLPDLVPTVISVGYIDKTTKEFVADASPKLEYERKTAVKFVVENKGDNVADSWRMNVVIPTQPHHIFHSDSMRTLLPGEKIEFIISFTQAKSGNQEITINVDPTCTDGCFGSVKESNETNNILKHSFTIRN